jgi:LacI family transcriptional regulator
MAASDHREEIERQDILTMVQRKVAGLLVVPSGFQIDHFSVARRNAIPIVAFDRPIRSVEADTLTVDNRAAAARATQHLIDHGHRNIMCVRRTDDDALYTRTERIAGYSEVMAHAKYPVRFCYMPGDLSGPGNNQLELVLNSSPMPTALFAVDNVVAVEVLRELQRRSIRIPEEIAVIAFDDFDAATLIRPSITVVRQPVVQIGREAAALLLARIDGDTASSSVPLHTVLPTELVIRESCGCGTQRIDTDRRDARNALSC